MSRVRFVALGALLVELVATLIAWPRLPARVPVHWNFSGEVDRWGPRWELLIIGPALLAGLWLLFELLPHLDPRLGPRFGRARSSDETEAERLGAVPAAMLITFLLIFGIDLLALVQALGLLHEAPRAHALLLAGFMLVFGNFVGRLRPSWFIGIRTPWTLSSDEVWRRTHRLAGWLLVPAGLVSAVAAVALDARAAFGTAIVLLVAALLVPSALSYVFWRRRTA